MNYHAAAIKILLCGIFLLVAVWVLAGTLFREVDPKSDFGVFLGGVVCASIGAIILGGVLAIITT